MVTAQQHLTTDILESLELAVLALAPVVDAAVLTRQLEGRTYALFFTVTQTQTLDDRLYDAVTLPEGWTKLVVPMCQLPYTEQGSIDRQALDQMGIPDLSSATLLESALTKLEGVQSGAVLTRPNRISPQRFHIAHLLPREQVKDPAIKLNLAEEPQSERAPCTQLALVETPALRLSENTPNTLGATLLKAVELCGEPRITYVTDADTELHQTFGELLAEAESTLGGLRQLGAKAGDYVLFQCTEPRNILPAFWGCLLGGLVPVICPVAATYDTVTTDLEKLLHVWRLLDKPLVVSEASRGVSLSQLQRQLEAKRPIPVVEKLRQQPRDKHYHDAAPNDVAFLVLTSGSTGSPKCIALTHHNILSRARGANQQCDQRDSDVILNWLPFDHIGSISDWHLRCVDLRCRMVYSNKEHVLGNPLNWLDLIARFRITHSWAPNFAYVLINAALESETPRSWDLSCMKSLLSAGESVSSATVEEFLTRLAAFGLARSAVRPAFGMAEVGSGITYFRPTLERPYAELSVDRRSLNSTLVEVGADHPLSISFTDLGTTIPGMGMRIVDDRGQVVLENTIGNLHVKGEAVTPGYVRNPEANAKVLLRDGWFDTGDRGFIVDSQLFLTGRSKETIIVNGSNYYPGELEAAAERTPGVLVSYTAACAVRPQGAQSERVALFLCHEPLPPARQAALLRDVSARVGKKTGVVPDYILPVQTQHIPKTAVGKLQRAELVRRFELGEFSDLMQRVDCLLENDTTLPNRFFRVQWRPSKLRPSVGPREGLVLVLSDATGVAELVTTELINSGRHALRIAAGPSFDFRSGTAWQVNFHSASQMDELCSMLGQMGISQFEIADLRGYAAVSETRAADALDASLNHGCFDTLNWLQALRRHRFQPSRYCVFACGAQPGAGGAAFDAGRALTIPLLKAFEHGAEQFKFQHVDLPYEDKPSAVAARIVAELSAANKEQEVAYRDEVRLTCKLQLIDFNATHQSPHPLLAPGQIGPGFCLITGGLGGIGSEVARVLLRRGAKVLLVGRSPLGSDSSDALRDLERSGSVMYQMADVTSVEQLTRAVNLASQAWGETLSGVLHLAGVGREAVLEDESVETLRETLAPKVFGTLAIEQLLGSYADAYCVLFSSAVTTIDTSQTAAYAMANAYLDAWAVYSANSDETSIASTGVLGTAWA